jgi:hypothetical protein
MTGTTMDGGVVLVVGNYERTRFFFTSFGKLHLFLIPFPPCTTESLAGVKNEILSVYGFAPSKANHGHTAIVAIEAIAVRDIDFPMRGDNVVTDHIEKIGYGDVFDREANGRELLEEPLEPGANGFLTAVGTTGSDVTRINERCPFCPIFEQRL